MTRTGKGFWRVSPLLLRILAVNVGALLVLLVGLLYTGQYERGLIRTDIAALSTEGRLLAAALSEGGARGTLEGERLLAEDLSRQMLRRLAGGDDTRVIVFGKSGALLLDNHKLLGPGGVVQIVPLDPPFRTWSAGKKVAWVAERGLSLLPFRLRLPFFPQELSSARDYPGLAEVLSGGAQVQAGSWRDQDGQVLLTVALPVQNLKNVMGAVFMMRTGRNIETAVRAAQFSVLRAFLAALGVTLLLSIYLSETIVAPILRLHDATEKVSQSILLKDAIPDLSWRRDEIGDLSRAFRRMTGALAARIDAISGFAADVAHEIRNPLASVRSAVETLMRLRDPAQQEKLLAVIHHDVDRMNRLITDIASISRLDSELERAEKETFDLAPVLSDVAAMEQTRAGDRARIVLHDGAGLRLPLTGNLGQVAQIVHNIVDNALSFVPQGGRIDIRAAIEGDRIVLHIDNEGPPIPENRLESVFARFYSERPEGEAFGLHSGLGLSISRQIARAHGGDIVAQNTGGGVRFTVILPAGPGTR